MGKNQDNKWLFKELGEISTIKSGGTPSRAKKEYWNGEIPWVKISDISKEYINETSEFITPEGLKNSSTNIFPKGTILFTIFATIGKVGILNIDATTNQAIAGITPNEKVINSKFLTYSLRELALSLENQGKGVAQKNINLSILKSTKIPLPPLPEQERIVAKLDSIFAHLDVSKQGLGKIPVLLKEFRQAVLTQAVTGKLTEEWRKGKELAELVTKKVKKASRNLLDDKSKDYDFFNLPINWEWKTISDVSDIKGGKRLPKGETLVRYDTGLPYIKAGDLKKGTVLYDKLEYLLPETQKKIKNYTISKGDVYITNVGACIGDSGIVPDELDGANLTENALKMCNQEGVINKYLAFWLRSPISQKFIQQSILSAAQGKLALGRVEVFPIPLCSLEEQTEIVRRVEALFSKADAIEAQYKKLKEQIDQLPQAVLAKAFRGEV